jgi:hypothetical protein
MNLKEKWENINQKQKKSIYYWALLIVAIDTILIAQQSVNFAQTGMCRNYMEFGSLLQSCTLFEFVKYGWSWVSFTTTFVLIPAAAFMMVANYVVDLVFVKNK